MAFAIRRPTPPLMAQISRHFFTPLFSFAIESYIHETDFTLGHAQAKMSPLSPLIIGFSDLPGILVFLSLLTSDNTTVGSATLYATLERQ